MRNPINGWIRLGILLSGIWVLAFCAYLFYEYRSCEDDFASRVWHSRNSLQWQVIGDEGPFFTFSLEGTLPEGGDYGTEFIRSKTICNIKVGPCFIWMFGPVIVGWAIIPLSVWSCRWVGKGFRPKNT
jgi:hypothetical protein